MISLFTQVIEADRLAAEEKGMAVKLKPAENEEEDDFRPPVIEGTLSDGFDMLRSVQ